MMSAMGLLGIGIFCLSILRRFYGISWTYKSIFLLWVWLGYGLVVSALYTDMTSVTFSLIFGSILFMGATIDMYLFILPDEGAVSLFIVGLVRIIGEFGGSTDSIMEALAIGMFFYFLRRISNNGVGCGDIKWAMAASLWLDPFYGCIMLICAFLLGSLAVPIIMVCQKKRVKRIPFGPFLNCGAAFAYVAPHLLWFNEWLTYLGYQV